MNPRKQKLIDLGPEPLATALLDLSVQSEAADDMITRLLSTEKESIARFKRVIDGLKRARKPLWGRSAFELSQKLAAILQDVRTNVTDPMTGFELLVRFYELDQYIFNRCDDSGGFVGDVFRIDAKKLFTEYAVGCRDKEKVADRVFTLMRVNDFGVRDDLIMNAGKYLPENNIRFMISLFQEQADTAKETFAKRRSLRYIEDLARQIEDAELFKKTRIAACGRLTESSLIDLARIYQNKKEFTTALSWLEEVSQQGFESHERDKILCEIYREQGHTEKLTDLLYAQFRSHRSLDTLEDLLELTGPEKRNEYIWEAAEDICTRSTLRISDIQFLIEVEMANDAQKLLCAKYKQIDGYSYYNLPPIAKSLEEKGYPLGASLIYRQLLISILERGYTKAYSHGVRYLKKLDSLAESITDWKGADTQGTFKDTIMQKHGRKRSFWAKYEGKK
ncbi:MAG: DUF6880 family protein [Fibrobacterota bacterium]